MSIAKLVLSVYFVVGGSTLVYLWLKWKRKEK
jgi:hypothetical protein